MKKIILILLLLSSCSTTNYTIYNPEKHTVIEKLKYIQTIDNTNSKFIEHYFVVKDTDGKIDTIPVPKKVYNKVKYKKQ